MIVIFAADAAAPQASSQVAAAPEGALRWVCPDKPENNLTYYPDRARDRGIAGAANVDCTVAASGRVMSCTLTKEEPPKWGFGEKALHTACLLRFKPLADPDAPPYSVNKTFRFGTN